MKTKPGTAQNVNFTGKAKYFMIQGTTSSAGKSALTAGFLRYFSMEGYSSSPFKSQNMSLNSFVTDDGFEIAVSQAVQSEAAFKNPIRQVNPILIKPASDCGMHLIVEGKFYGNMNFNDYAGKRDYFLKKAKESFEFLAQDNDLIILEGAGSPAEINLFKFDIANMGFAEVYDIPVILVADVERGGVFASVFGTVKLLPLKWRRLIKGFIINKFRGDLRVLTPGIKSIESMVKIPCFGVIPHIKNLRLEAEDSLNLTDRPEGGDSNNLTQSGRLRIGIIHLNRISNFHEFDPLFYDNRVAVRFFKDVPKRLTEFDMIIIPGSKSTIGDILGLKKAGIFDYIKDFEKYGVIMGICGGFQMMGKWIKDPFHIESETFEAAGFGFFETVTVMQNEKRLLNQQYRFNPGSNIRSDVLRGYEIHNGRTFFIEGCSDEDTYTRIFESAPALHDSSPAEMGIMSKDNKKIGTYIHGLFANKSFKNFVIDIIIKNLKTAEKGNKGKVCACNIQVDGHESEADSYFGVKNRNYDLLSENIRKHINIDLIKNLTGI
ncbi:MAG: cobyric acid synthase [Deltaproteobacteria bacterium]|nr:cobyric acid synthase [Deltaproteobacteria bacterium]